MRCHKSGIFLAGSHRVKQSTCSVSHREIDREREGEIERERESCKGFSGRISRKNAVIIHHSPLSPLRSSNSAQTDNANACLASSSSSLPSIRSSRLLDLWATSERAHDCGNDADVAYEVRHRIALLTCNFIWCRIWIYSQLTYVWDKLTWQQTLDHTVVVLAWTFDPRSNLIGRQKSDVLSIISAN